MALLSSARAMLEIIQSDGILASIQLLRPNCQDEAVLRRGRHLERVPQTNSSGAVDAVFEFVMRFGPGSALAAQ
jgi:hypothetical protein